jgi:DNA polymerase III delta prime subunit
MKDQIEALRNALQDAMVGHFDMSKMGGFRGLGADGDKHDALENAEDGLHKEADELEAQMERQREKIMANKEIDQRKKDELFNRIGEKKKRRI